MRPTLSQYAEALDMLAHEGKADSKVLAQNFLGLLRRRGESHKAGAIIAQLERLERTKKQEVSVMAITGHPVMETLREMLEERVKKLFPGKTVRLEYQVDPEVIGGVRFQSEEKRYDATLRADLSALKQSLT